MHPPTQPPTPEDIRNDLRDADFQIAVANVIRRYFPNINRMDQLTIGDKTLELVKARAEEAVDDLET